MYYISSGIWFTDMYKGRGAYITSNPIQDQLPNLALRLMWERISKPKKGKPQHKEQSSGKVLQQFGIFHTLRLSVALF